jgi:hypothetical protein
METLEYLAQNAGVDLTEFRDNYSNYPTKNYYIPKPKIKRERFKLCVK